MVRAGYFLGSRTGSLFSVLRGQSVGAPLVKCIVKCIVNAVTSAYCCTTLVPDCNY